MVKSVINECILFSPDIFSEIKYRKLINSPFNPDHLFFFLSTMTIYNLNGGTLF